MHLATAITMATQHFIQSIQATQPPDEALRERVREMVGLPQSHTTHSTRSWQDMMVEGSFRFPYLPYGCSVVHASVLLGLPESTLPFAVLVNAC